MKLSSVLILSCVLAGTLHAVPIAVSNLGQPVGASTYGIGKSVPAFDFQNGVSFTTGAGQYAFDSATFSIYSQNGAGSGFTVGLYADVSAAGPTGLIATLTGASAPTAGLATYFAPSATTLLGNTTYWLVVSAPTTPALSGFSLAGTTSLAEDAGALPGWALGDARMVSNNGGASWFAASSTSGVLKYSVQASAVPDVPSTALLFGCAAVSLIGLRRRIRFATTGAV